MARWDHDAKTVHARVVYYGPARAGKTANLEALHRAADARRGPELLTVKTEADSTLFFDLLPFSLEDVLGYRVEIALFSVPGQVRLDATRRVVLAGADVIVFVVDSSESQREKNMWSLQNLRMNMRAKSVDPARVPVLYQINKRDSDHAAPAAEVSEWLALADEQVIPAVASRGEGVIETLKAACREFLSRPPEAAEGGPPRPFDREQLARALDRALAPFEERVRHGRSKRSDSDTPRTPIILDEADPLEGAIETSVLLGEERTHEAERARRLAREAEGFRRLGEALCDFGRETRASEAIESALAIAREVVEASCMTVIRETAAGPLVQEGCVGCEDDPLHAFASGRDLLRRLMSADPSGVIEELSDHCSTEDAADLLAQQRSVAAVPFSDGEPHAIVAYAAQPDGRFQQRDLTFLRSVARHVAAVLGKTRIHEDIAAEDERLGQGVALREGKNRRVGSSRRTADRIREKFLAELANEMRAPVAAVASAAEALHDMKADPSERKKLARSIAGSAQLLERNLDGLNRLVRIAADPPFRPADIAVRELLDLARERGGHKNVKIKIDESCRKGRFDPEGLSRAVAEMIDNAVCYSPPRSTVHVRVGPGRLETEAGETDALVVSVLDRGPGVKASDRERIFAPFTRADASPGAAMGVGLYDVRREAERHGGTVCYAPRSGGGSEFRLTVPMQPVNELTRMEVTRG